MRKSKPLAWSRQEVPSSRYALVVGINKYGGDGSANLNGCLNDAWRWASYLQKAGWPHDNIRMLTDQAATRDAVLNRLRWLVTASRPGDRIAFTFSGHGTQVRDRDGDELADNMDEALCCYGCMADWNNGLILDDDLACEFRKLAPGVHLTVVLDACHSGSGTRNSLTNGGEHYRRTRFMAPPMHIEWRSAGVVLPVKRMGRGVLGWIGNRTRGEVVVPTLNHVLLSGCRADQTSADAFIDGSYCGALSHHALKALEANRAAKATQTLKDLNERLKQARFEQEPQLEGPSAMLNQPLFG